MDKQDGALIDGVAEIVLRRAGSGKKMTDRAAAELVQVLNRDTVMALARAHVRCMADSVEFWQSHLTGS